MIDTTQSFSVSAWVNLAGTNGFQTFVSQDGTQVSGFYLQLRGDSHRFAFTRLAYNRDLKEDPSQPGAYSAVAEGGADAAIALDRTQPLTPPTPESPCAVRSREQVLLHVRA